MTVVYIKLNNVLKNIFVSVLSELHTLASTLFNTSFNIITW